MTIGILDILIYIFEGPALQAEARAGRMRVFRVNAPH